MQHPETQHRVSWLDRLRIERVVWSLDQRLYDLPRRTRIETRREVRQNLLTGARDVGTTQALRNLGSSGELAEGYLSAEFGSGPRHSWMAAGVFALLVPLLATSIFADAASAFADGITAADPNATGTYTWERDLAPAEHRQLHVRQRRGNVDRRRLHAALLRHLDRRDDPRRPALARAPGLAETSRRRRVICRNRVGAGDDRPLSLEPHSGT